MARPLSQPIRARTRLDPETRREQIIDAAAHVFEGRDPADVTFEEIADAAGVSRALVYNYFGDRGGLVAAVYLRSSQRLDYELAVAVDRTSPPAMRLRQIVRSYLRFARANAGLWQLLGLAGTVQHPAVQAARRRRLDQLADEWGGTPDARIAARGVVGLLEGATFDWAEADDADPERVADVLSELLWSGVSGSRLGR